jgi:triacylglycerol lipase
MTRVGELARGLLLFLAVEAGCYLLIASAVWRTHGWPVALLCVMLLALGVRAVPVLLLYAIALANAGPVPAECRLGLTARIGYALQEIGAAAVIYTLLHPFAWLLMPREPLGHQPGTRMPVLLVHGYFCNRGVWWPLKRWLEARGHAVFTVDLEPVFGDIDGFADIVAARVAQVTTATGGKVQVIAASMGGLALRAYLCKHGGARIARVVTLGTPHHGTRHARLALGVDGRQMLPGSAWLSDLARAEAGELAAPVVSIYSCHDNMVSPVSSGRLEGAGNVALPGVGHLSMAFSRRVRRALAEHLD